LFEDSPGREFVVRAEDAILRLRDVHSCSITTDETGRISEVHVVASTDRTPKMIARDVETILKAEFGIDIDYRKIGVVLINSLADTPAPEAGTETAEQDRAPTPSREESDRPQPVPHDREHAAGVPGGGGSASLDGGAEASGSPDGGGKMEAPGPRLEFLEEDARIRFTGLTRTITDDHIDISVTLEKSGIEAIGCLAAVRGGGPPHRTIAEAALHALMELVDEQFTLTLGGVGEASIAGTDAVVAVVELVDGRTVRRYVGCVRIGHDAEEAVVLAVLDAVNRPFGRWKTRTEIHYTIR
jgi:hypothetical protein